MDEYMASETNDCLPANDRLSTNGRFLQSKAIWLTQQEIDSLPTTWLEPPASLKGNRDEQRQRLRDFPVALNTPCLAKRRRSSRHPGSTPPTPAPSTSWGVLPSTQSAAFGLVCEYTDESWRPRLENLLHHLGDRGIGGELA
ncbi:MAG: hypothetical protein R3E31_07725 [Chloroflexota bacterium]